MSAKKTTHVPLTSPEQILFDHLQSLSDWTSYLPKSQEDVQNLQSLMFQRLIIDGELPEPKASKESDHKKFIEAWEVAYKAHWKFDYKFSGGRDAKAVKGLLPYGTIEELIELARRAWSAIKGPKRFGCEQAITIHGFYTNYNKIRAELAPEQNGHRNGEGLTSRTERRNGER